MDRGAWWATVHGVTKRASEGLATEHTYWLKACELALGKNTQCSPLGKHAQGAGDRDLLNDAQVLFFQFHSLYIIITEVWQV